MTFFGEIGRYIALRRIARRNKEIQDELVNIIRKQGKLTDEQEDWYIKECERLKNDLKSL